MDHPGSEQQLAISPQLENSAAPAGTMELSSLHQTFTYFPQLPVETQLDIWVLCATVEPKTPEVCVVWPYNMIAGHVVPDNNEWDCFDARANTAWPAVAHVCRVAREEIIRRGLLRLRYLPVAGCMIPFRTFDPEIDTLYWAQQEAPHIRNFCPPEELRVLHSLKHIAIDISDTPPWDSNGLVTDLIAACENLKTVSVVLRDMDCNERDPNDVPDQVLGRTTISFDVRGRPPVPPCPAEQFVDWFRKELEGRTALVTSGPPLANRRTSAVKVKVQSFVECVKTPNPSQEWREPWWQDAEEDTSDYADEDGDDTSDDADEASDHGDEASGSE
ncbi:hypothetical protein B0T24DRAFT_677317 [Lasiosphaeria ovina]|uniref:2EXR domain-containing protein n=1 Tax=Lasiosphaeria ovina TaxID=92902 RepID=A0AAE0KI74_9PEZI|nr:hypothetical protein B0T24DRAFT_677317 [Lasiosphaeria ovina]